MAILIFLAVYFIMVSFILTYELFKTRQELKVEKSVSSMYHNSAEEYWRYYMSEQRKNRSKALLIKELQEENAELEELLAHKELELDNANEWADGWAEAYSRVLDEWKVVLHEKEKLQFELANESEWAMEYAESVDKYGALYLEALKKADELEDKVQELETYIMEIEYGDDM